MNRLREARQHCPRAARASFHSLPPDYILRNNLNDASFMSVLLPTVTFLFFFIPDRLCHFWAGQCVYCHCAVISRGGASVSNLAGCV